MGLPQISANENENADLISYGSWQMKHPSALDEFDQMMSIARGKKIVVFLDYDGTLSNIVDNPDEAFMAPKMRTAVSDVARRFPTAIISGRKRDKVYEFVELDDVYYAGSHGLDIAAPLQSLNFGDPKHQTIALDNKGNEIVLFQPAQKYLPAIQKIISALSKRTKCIKGVMIENNKFCISVHFRHVHDEDFCTLENIVKSTLQGHKEFRLAMGIKVFEIRPDIEWDKGHALEYLLDTLGLGRSSDVLPIYIGDDRTDEDAFKVIRSRGQGYPIVVSSTPKETMALNSLRNPTEVNKFLLRLARWNENVSPKKLAKFQGEKTNRFSQIFRLSSRVLLSHMTLSLNSSLVIFFPQINSEKINTHISPEHHRNGHFGANQSERRRMLNIYGSRNMDMEGIHMKFLVERSFIAIRVVEIFLAEEHVTQFLRIFPSFSPQ